MARVYLAGPITGCTYGECTNWREEFPKLLGSHIKCLSPMRHKEYLNKELSVADHYDEHILSTMKAITTRDRWDCQRADVVVVNLLGAKKVSIGTVMEIAWADAARVPIVLVMEKEGNVHEHGMLVQASGFRVDNLKDAAYVLRALLVD